MIPPSEWLVVALLAAIYLADCVVLLARGQALVEFPFNKVLLSFGSAHYAIRERPVALLNPVTPCAPAIRTLELYESAPPDALACSAAIRALAPVRALVWLQAPLVLAALPFTLWRNDAAAFLGVLALAYLNALAMLLLLLLAYRRLGAPAGPAWSLGFAGLACLPLSVNFFRGALLRLPVRGDALRFLRLTRGAARESARSALLAQVAESVHGIEENTFLHARLRSLQERLKHERL